MIKPSHGKTVGVALWLLMLVLTPRLMWADAASTAPQSAFNSHFVLKAEEHRLSLNATHASLKEILHEMGQRMNIAIITRMPDQTVTTSFTGLTVMEALKHLNVNAIYFQHAEGDHKRITKIIALQRGRSTRQPSPAAMPHRAPGPTPFRFEFDPKQAEHKTQRN